MLLYRVLLCIFLLYLCYLILKKFLAHHERFEPRVQEELKRELKDEIENKKRELLGSIENLDDSDHLNSLGNICGHINPCNGVNMFCKISTPHLPRGDDSFIRLETGSIGICLTKSICRDKSKIGTPEYTDECIDDLKK